MGSSINHIPDDGELENLRKLAEAQPGKPLTAHEKSVILAMADDQLGPYIIGKRIGRSPDAVRKFLDRFRSTTKLARAHLERGAETLAKRVVKSADVDQSLEVLDRLEVLPKRNVGMLGSQFSVVVNMPGAGAQVPTDKDIIDAKLVADQPQLEE